MMVQRQTIAATRPQHTIVLILPIQHAITFVIEKRGILKASSIPNFWIFLPKTVSLSNDAIVTVLSYQEELEQLSFLIST